MPDPGEGVPRAVLLAAGQGSRLGGRPKGSLRIAGQTLIERLADGLRAAGVAEIVLVVGPYRDRLLPLAARAGVWPLVHPGDAPSHIDSQRLAIADHVARASTGSPLWMVLADMPLLSEAPLRAVAAAWAARPPGTQALVPVVGGVPGHPVVLSAEAVRRVHAMPATGGVRDLLRQPDATVWRWPTTSQAHVRDIDTAEDVDRLREEVSPSEVAW